MVSVSTRTYYGGLYAMPGEQRCFYLLSSFSVDFFNVSSLEKNYFNLISILHWVFLIVKEILSLFISRLPPLYSPPTHFQGVDKRWCQINS